MDVTVEVDTDLLTEVMQLTGAKDGRAAAEFALRELIRKREKVNALRDHAGTVEFYEGFDPRDQELLDDNAA